MKNTWDHSLDYAAIAFDYLDAIAKIRLISEHVRVDRLRGASNEFVAATARRADEHIVRMAEAREILGSAN